MSYSTLDIALDELREEIRELEKHLRTVKKILRKLEEATS
jgi:archaellum component FlaC